MTHSGNAITSLQMPLTTRTEARINVCLNSTESSLSFFFQAEDGIRDKLVTGVQTCVFFKEEDGIRDKLVTGVQTCALPIFSSASRARKIDPGGNGYPG